MLLADSSMAVTREVASCQVTSAQLRRGEALLALGDRRSAAEALLRRLTKQGSIPSINTLVDIGNLVSIRYALPVAKR